MAKRRSLNGTFFWFGDMILLKTSVHMKVWCQVLRCTKMALLFPSAASLNNSLLEYGLSSEHERVISEFVGYFE
ncbi:hypothetical protein VNO80_04539 [Phaseolus coccineus]|uniref:Uncharacterized protein n=1 Tax=Phaseolus coccineus TaxID=3886 RepID=A0AAN9RNC9_PHACN